MSRHTYRNSLIAVTVLLLAILDHQPAALQAQTPIEHDLVLSHQVISNCQVISLLDQGLVRFSIAGEVQERPITEVVRWGVVRPPQRFPLILLTDGSLLTFQTIERRKDIFKLQFNDWESVELHESLVRGIFLTPVGSSPNWQKLLAHLTNANGRDDQLLIRNRGWIGGTLAWSDKADDFMQPTTIQKFRVDGKETEIRMAEVEAILFSPVLTPWLTTPSSCKITTRDGSCLACNSWSIVQPGDYVQFRLNCGLTLQSLSNSADLAQTLSCLTSKPKNTKFLSDIEPTSYKQLDWLSTKWPLGRDRDLWNRHLILDEGIVEKGIAMHATSQAAFRWDRSPTQLKATLTLATPVEENEISPGAAIAKVMVVREGKLETLYTSPVLSAKTSPIDIDVSIDKAELIILLVDAGPRGTLGDHVLWLDARLSP